MTTAKYKAFDSR